MSARVIRFKTLLVALLAPSGPNRADDSDLLAQHASRPRRSG